MSILIAYKRGDTVYMGTDTRVIVDDNKKNELYECNYKIQKLDNGMLVGITADRIVRQTLFSYSEIFTLDQAGQLTKKHIIKNIVPALLKVLEKEDLLEKEDGELPCMEAQILIAYKGELYEICDSFTVYKYEDFQAIGDVSAYGQFVLANIKEGDNVNAEIVKALDVTARYSQCVGGPYLLIDTKACKYQLVGRGNV